MQKIHGFQHLSISGRKDSADKPLLMSSFRHFVIKATYPSVSLGLSWRGFTALSNRITTINLKIDEMKSLKGVADVL